MEKIKVNMSPNPLDVQTIHASQNDGEAREWGFELHNNGELIDTSEITEQLFFKAYKGGTEEILPTNGSVPTTSPFKGDIKYPQGLLTDQEFTYRQSPTEEDGLAKITDIKGNTLVWNQLVRDNLTDISQIQTNGSLAKAVSNNVLTLTVNGTVDSNSFVEPNSYANQIRIPTGHKALVIYNVNPSVAIRTRISYATVATPISEVQCPANTWTQVANIITSTNNARVMLYLNLGQTLSEGNTVQIKNITVFDLTQMGLDITDPSDFTSFFPLSYYSYNQGSLLSFNGNGIKTVGFNQWDEEWESGTIRNDGSKVASVSRIRSKNYIPVLPSTTYYTQINNYSIPSYACLRYAYDADKNPIGVIGSNYSASFTTPSNCHYILFSPNAQYGTTYKNDICINISDTERNGEYEPYTSSTLSLPISTYFPNGMKSAGNVYDELTESKAITRIGAVDLGTLNWSQRLIGTTPIGMQTNGLSATIKNPSTNKDIANIISTAGTASTWTIAMGGNSSSGLMAVSSGYLFIATTETNPTAFKSAMSGVYLYYELATSTETSFTTASLVTENTEIPLSAENDVLVGKCTEELSSVPGFIDAKIKLTDGDGTCYSNKIQLHVERKP